MKKILMFIFLSSPLTVFAAPAVNHNITIINHTGTPIWYSIDSGGLNFYYGLPVGSSDSYTTKGGDDQGVSVKGSKCDAMTPHWFGMECTQPENQDHACAAGIYAAEQIASIVFNSPDNCQITCLDGSNHCKIA